MSSPTVLWALCGKKQAKVMHAMHKRTCTSFDTCNDGQTDRHVDSQPFPVFPWEPLGSGPPLSGTARPVPLALDRKRGCNRATGLRFGIPGQRLWIATALRAWFGSHCNVPIAIHSPASQTYIQKDRQDMQTGGQITCYGTHYVVRLALVEVTKL